MFLLQIESMVRETINIESVTHRLITSFNNLVENNEEVRSEIEEIIGERYSYDVAFAGMSFHHRQEYTPLKRLHPFYRVCLHIVRKRDGKIVAQYELEFDSNDELIDEYFYFSI